jgi:hypothetical protein
MNFTILACFKNVLQAEFDKLNKKCEKYGNPLLSFTVDKIYEENNKEWANITVSGCVPKIGEYELISVISKLADGTTNLICNVPGKETPEEFRQNNFFCDHCKENRYRKEVVIVKGPEGYKQLGKTCLKDFLGINLENLVNQFSYIYELIQESQDEEFYPRDELVCSTQFFLERAAVCVRKLGFVSSKAAWDDPSNISTKEMAWRLCFPDSFMIKYIQEKELYVEQQDKDLVLEALKWVDNLEGKNDFEYNIKSVTNQENASYKTIGFLSAIIPCYKKSIEIHTDEESNWVGQPKERLDFAVKCTYTKELFSDYGLKTLVKFSNQGNLLTWFASGEVDYKVGENYIIKATVKEHSSFNNVKQTVISRVKKLNLDTK